MSAAEILTLVETTLGRRGARLEDRLVEDLGAESMDLLALVSALEDRYGVVIDEAEVPELRRVADLVARVARGTA